MSIAIMTLKHSGPVASSASLDTTNQRELVGLEIHPTAVCEMYARIFATVELFTVPSVDDLANYTEDGLAAYRNNMTTLLQVLSEKLGDVKLEHLTSKVIQTLEIIDMAIERLEQLTDEFDAAMDEAEYWADF